MEAEGRTFDKEVHDLYVSPVIAKALLDADPTLGSSVKDVRELLKAQFPPTTKDVTDDEMFDVMDDVLRLQSTTPGKLPLTLVVLDEMQQYIGDDNDKALAVQNIVQGCSARFESTVLFVATGQSALTATPTLQKLIDRFPLPVELSDNDVETVVREVVLRKKPEHVPLLKSTIDAAAGEIDRQLGGTRFAPRAEEKPKLVPDYPVLPNRWRLWSEMLRAVDRAGKSGLVRSQLGLIHGGVRAAADRPVGNVIGADYLFFDDKAHVDMLMSGVLLREVDDFIQRMMSEGGDSAVKGRLCALIFLISQMSQPVLGGETGLRATAPFLADLLVEDLAEDGARLRKRVPELLDELVAEGRIVQDGDDLPASHTRGRRVGEGLPHPPRRRPRRRHAHEPAPQRATHGRRRGRPRRPEAHPRREQDPPQARHSLGAGRTRGRRRWRPRVGPGRVVGERVGREEGRRRGR